MKKATKKVKKGKSTKKGKDDIYLEYRRLADMVKWPHNPKEHDLPQIESSIRRFGFVQPPTIDEKSGMMAAGHGRVEATERIKEKGKVEGFPWPPRRVRVDKDGEWLVPVIRGVRFKDEDEMEAFAIADNRLVELGGWNEELLVDRLQNLVVKDALDGIGYSRDDIDSLMAFLSVGSETDFRDGLDEGLATGAAKKATRLIITCESEFQHAVLQEHLGLAPDAKRVTVKFSETSLAKRAAKAKKNGKKLKKRSVKK